LEKALLAAAAKVNVHVEDMPGLNGGYGPVMTNPAAQPRRIFLASLVLLALIALVLLLANGQLLAAVVVGVVAVAALVAGARPTGENRS
jgi:hypothetical protein